MSGAFAVWNRGQLAGYLVEISAEILRAVDPETNRPMVDMVLDKAGQKGTGKWTAQVALDLGVPVPTISAALDGRALSSMKEERAEAAWRYGRVPGQLPGATAEWIEALGQALYAAKICCYAQGMSLISAGAREWGWKIHLREMARIWTGGCIIRARLLNEVMRAYEKEPALANLLLDGELQSRLRQALPAWRRVVAAAAELGVPAPAFAASLAYFDAYTSAELPQNLTQAQRDYFGAHTYQRTDRPEAGFVHSDWSALGARRES